MYKISFQTDIVIVTKQALLYCIELWSIQYERPIIIQQQMKSVSKPEFVLLHNLNSISGLVYN